MFLKKKKKQLSRKRLRSICYQDKFHKETSSMFKEKKILFHHICKIIKIVNLQKAE